MKIAVITSRYPSEKEPYNHMFVHVRNKFYLQTGTHLSVFVPSKEDFFYTFEGVNVHRLPSNKIIKKLEHFDVVFIHLLHIYPIKDLDGSIIYEHIIRSRIPVLFFLHGIEVQKIWKSYKEEIEILSPKSLLRFLYHDFYQIPKMKKYIRLLIKHPKCRFIAVSQWMKEEVYENIKVDITEKTVIIPNGIDTKLFAYSNQWNHRHKLLAIRPLILKGKYAIDLAISTMKNIREDSIKLTIYGKGKDYKKITNLIHRYKLLSKITIVNQFLNHSSIPKIHKKFGIYYAVTKTDSQGVSMCEAMASGLPVISFKVGGIPEFITPKRTGILVEPYNVKEAAQWIESLVYDKNLYLRISENARKFIETIDIRKTTEAELRVARNLL